MSVRKSRQAFTLIEMLVTLMIVGVLASLTGVLWVHSRAKARAILCMSNQKDISKALVSFYADKGHLPSDDPRNDLAVELEGYIHYPPHLHDVNLPDVYRCPNDRRMSIFNSYQPYYVQRKEPHGAEYFVLGCPRHDDVQGGYINTFGLDTPGVGRAGRTTANGKPISTETAPEERTIKNGSMEFEDGSKVTVTSSSDDYNVTAVASFRQEEGRLYTIVRVTGKGESDFDVTPGAQFEVITPVAIIGVKGTTFTVKSGELFAQIVLKTGIIEVWDRLLNRTIRMQAGEELTVGTPPTPNLDHLCIHCREHCRHGRHCKRCPLHVGKPQNIGTNNCVECPDHCWQQIKERKWTRYYHCQWFCPKPAVKVKYDDDDHDLTRTAH